MNHIIGQNGELSTASPLSLVAVCIKLLHYIYIPLDCKIGTHSDGWRALFSVVNLCAPRVSRSLPPLCRHCVLAVTDATSPWWRWLSYFPIRIVSEKGRQSVSGRRRPWGFDSTRSSDWAMTSPRQKKKILPRNQTPCGFLHSFPFRCCFGMQICASSVSPFFLFVAYVNKHGVRVLGPEITPDTVEPSGCIGPPNIG